MPDERRQFGILYRDFLHRMVDLELLSVSGEVEKLLGQFAALLAAFSFTFLIVTGPKYLASPLPHQALAAAAQTEMEFLLSTTMAVAGLFALLAWNTVFPDRRDCLVLGLLPVRTRTIFLAKLASIATALGISIVAINVFTGLCYPFILAPDAGFFGTLRSFAAYWFTQALAGLLAYCALLALQGLAAQFLRYRRFLRVSSFIQLAAFFTIIGVYFLQPPFPNTRQLAAHSYPHWLGWLPPYWLLGFFQRLNGAADGAFSPFASRAIWGVALTASIAVSTFVLAYRRNIRRIIEEPDIAPADRSRPATRIFRFLVSRLLSQPVERAILLFTARTIARSRQHRLLLAAYGGIGLAFSLAYAKDLLYGSSNMEMFDLGAPWNRVNLPSLAASLILLFFAVTGARAVFALPFALRANWVFQVTASYGAAAYFTATRKALYTLAALPIWFAAALLYFTTWPPAAALQALALLILIGVALVEISLHQFRKIPFTCSYLPGKANLNVKLGIYALALLFAANEGVQIEYWAMQKPARLMWVSGILLAAAVLARLRTTKFVRSPHYRIEFEDLPPGEILGLNLRGDSPLGAGNAAVAAGDAGPNGPGGGGNRDDDLDQEIAAHLRMAANDRMDRGEPPAQARFAALQEFGNVLMVKEKTRAVWTWTAFEQFLLDLRSGARVLTNSPAFSAAAIALIAVGIGGNTTIYSMIHAVLTKSAPGVQAKGLVTFGLLSDGKPDEPGHSFPDYLDFAAQSRTMRSLAAFGGGRFTMVLANGSFEMRGHRVTANYFDTIGVRMAKGRGFTEEEARGRAALAVVIAYHVWQNQFQGDGDIIGRSIILNGQPATIVGVTAPKFRGTMFAPNFEVCVPLVSYALITRTANQLANRSFRNLEIIGQLAPGRGLADAEAEFRGISQRLQSAYPETNRGKVAIMAPYAASAFAPWQNAQTRLVMAILTAVALLALLIVCANVANLMLARSVARQREMAVRQSLGAPRVRILRILLAEGIVLSLAAWGAAWLFASWATRAIDRFLPMPPLASGARFEADLTPDWRVAVYALALAVVTALAFTLAPALRLWRQDLLPWLRAGEHGLAQGRSRLANVLVVLQVAFSMLLLTAAGLGCRSIFQMGNLDLHFAKDHLLLVPVSTSGAALSEPENILLLERLRERLRVVPGVVSVSYTEATPPGNFGGWGAAVVGADSSSGPVSTSGTDAGPGYLETLGVTGVIGRGFVADDVLGAKASAVINANLAEALWPGQSALGRTLSINGQSLHVAGIAPNGAFSTIQPGSRSNFVFAGGRKGGSGPGSITFFVRYTGNLESLAPAIRAAVREVDSRIPVAYVHTMETELLEYTAPQILITALLGLFSTGSLIVAAIGLYAVVAFHTVRRTRDFGIRMALGASSRQILTTVLKEGLLLAAIGSAIGLALSLAAAQSFRGFLFGVAPSDAMTYSGAAALLAAVSLLACLAPARRAARTDPIHALRHD